MRVDACLVSMAGCGIASVAGVFGNGSSATTNIPLMIGALELLALVGHYLNEINNRASFLRSRSGDHVHSPPPAQSSAVVQTSVAG